ncbi:baseplate J/gp47 family protein [Patescibacteria group bacterium]|nr:baseplate J/gp47 family protein [Patescibacteria group bacterium]
MELKNLLTRLGKTEKPEHFLALEIGPGFLKSAIWEVFENETKITRFGSIEEFSGDDEAAFIAAVDLSFTRAIEDLTVSPSGVIFGLPENWLTGEAVVDDKKLLLKTVCEKFDLKPLGFVQSQEALLHFFRLKEGIPLNAILVRLNSSGVWIGVAKNGQIIGEQTVGRSNDLGNDVEEGLARLEKVETYPTRIILFNSDTINEEIKEQLESYSWQERLPFLHAPKVETLTPMVSIEAIAIAGGAEVARSLGFEIKAAETEDSVAVKEAAKNDEVVEDEVKPVVNADELGFVQSKDVLENEVEPVETMNRESILPAKKRFKLPSFKSGIIRLKSLIKKFSLPQFKKSGRLPWVLGGIIGLLGVVFIGLFVLWWNVPKAEVVLYLEPKILEEELVVILDPQAKNFDLENKLIPAEIVEVIIEESKTKTTTGEGLVGDPANGEVIIYNKTNLEKIFELGTVLIGPDKLKFTLDNEVKIASQSAEEAGITYGKVTAEITAASIGTEGNLPGGSEFSLKDYPESVYSAKTEAGLTGGTSRQVKTVNQEDQEELLAELKEKLTLGAQEELNQKFPDKKILDKNIIIEVLNQDFDGQPGDEAENLSLTLKFRFKTLVFSEAMFNSMVMEWIRESVPSGFVLHQNNLQTDFKEVELNENLTARVTTMLKLNLVPEIDQAEIKNNLVGRYPPVIREYLKSLTNFVAVDITIKPLLPARLNTLPHKPENINLEIRINH